jgi:hypothetical protein
LKEYVTIEDFFLKFRYKKRHIVGKNIFQPYVKKEDASDHEFALIFPLYKKIIQTYWEVITEQLLEGKPFIMPRELGMIELVKQKKKVSKRGIVYRNLHTNGYVPRVAWFKFKHARFLHKTWYTFNLSRKVRWKQISKALFENPDKIYNLSNSIKKPQPIYD